ncbi:hypothetical protein [Streptomyces sp. NTH33]|uniref:hypothetical protein n=1 Tax=Streptomyces sp. NTH33 TaxID=1735453 RepID=UPI0011B93F53|nr:hypothetical protein [Streptomyces sp. NTH33]
MRSSTALGPVRIFGKAGPRQGSRRLGNQRQGETAMAMNAKKIVVYVLVAFALYVIITDPDGATDYVRIGFEGISDAAKAIGDFMTWVASRGE